MRIKKINDDIKNHGKNNFTCDNNANIDNDINNNNNDNNNNNHNNDINTNNNANNNTNINTNNTDKDNPIMPRNTLKTIWNTTLFISSFGFSGSLSNTSKSEKTKTETILEVQNVGSESFKDDNKDVKK